MLRQRRLPALILVLCLFGGGLGLPLLDALVFHSSGAAEAASVQDEWTRVHTHGSAHALGCHLWAGAASGTGLPSVGCQPPAVVQEPDHPKYPPSVVADARTDLSLRYSRAPPQV